MSARATRPSTLAILALLGLLSSSVSAQQEAKAASIKIPAGKKFQYSLPVPFELTCPHHVSAFSDDNNVFTVEVPSGFTKKPKVTLIPQFAGVATLNFGLVGKDEFQGESGNCTGSFNSSVTVRVLPDDKQIDKFVKQVLDALTKSLRQGYKGEQKDFNQAANQIVDDYKEGFVTLDSSLDSLNTAYFDATFSNLLSTRVGLTNASSQISNELASNGATPGFVGGHSQAGSWQRWDQSVYDISMNHEDAAQDLDATMWKTWSKIRGLTTDPDLVPEFTLVRISYNYLSEFALIPPNTGDWVQTPARLPASIYYMIGYAKECDPNSGALTAAGVAFNDANLHGELHIGSDTLNYDFSADSNGVWQASFGQFGSYGHSSGGSDGAVTPVPSGLARYDVFYDAETDPTNSVFITIP